jgi:hypothetical protein
MDNPLLLHIDGLSDKLTRYAASQEQEMMEMRARLEQMRGHVIATSTTALPDAFSSNGMIISFPADSSPSPPVSHAHVEFACIEEKVDVEDVMDSAAEAVHGLETMGTRKTGSLPRGLSYFNCMYERGRVHEAIDADARYAEVLSGIREAFVRRDTVGVLKRLNALHRIWKNAKQEPQTGVIAAFANSHAFAASISVIIVINCILSIVEVNTRADRIFAGDHLYARPEIWNILENIFLAIYIAELALRLFVSRIYFFAGHEFWWNMIDVSIVILASLDCLAGSVRAIRVFRISRLLRMVRFLRFVKTLRLLVDCLIQSVINMVSCVIMLAFIIGFFALYFVSAVAQHAAENYNELEPDTLQELGTHYGSFQAAMLSLFEACSGGQDWGEYYRSIALTGWANAGVFLFFIAFFFLAVFNIVTSVFVEKVIALAQPDIEDRLAEMQAHSHKFAEDFYGLCKSIVQEDHCGHITFQQFDFLLKHEYIRDMLAVRGVDIHETKHFFDLIAMSEANGDASTAKSISLEMLAAVCMRSKGMATAVDLLTFRFETKQSITQMAKNQQALMETILLEDGQMQSRMTEGIQMEVNRILEVNKIINSWTALESRCTDSRTLGNAMLTPGGSRRPSPDARPDSGSLSGRSARSSRSPSPVDPEDVVRICDNAKELLNLDEKSTAPPVPRIPAASFPGRAVTEL